MYIVYYMNSLNRTTLELKLSVPTPAPTEMRGIESHHFGIETQFMVSAYRADYHIESHHFGIETGIFNACLENMICIESHHFGIETIY